MTTSPIPHESVPAGSDSDGQERSHDNFDEVMELVEEFLMGRLSEGTLQHRVSAAADHQTVAGSLKGTADAKDER